MSQACTSIVSVLDTKFSVTCHLANSMCSPNLACSLSLLCQRNDSPTISQQKCEKGHGSGCCTNNASGSCTNLIVFCHQRHLKRKSAGLWVGALGQIRSWLNNRNDVNYKWTTTGMQFSNRFAAARCITHEATQSWHVGQNQRMIQSLHAVTFHQF